MTVEVKELEYCKLEVHFVADPEAVLEKREEAVNTLKKSNVKVAGFRNLSNKKASKKGSKKSPKTTFKKSKSYELALQRQYKAHIDKTVMSELVAEGYDESLFETKIKPIGYPNISNVKLENDHFSCDMVFLHKPDFELNEYKEFEVPRPESDNVTEEAEKLLQMLREQHGDVVPFEESDFVQENDSLTMDVKSTIDGVEIESLTQQGLFYTVGQQFNNKEFDTHLLGMKAGDEKVFTITFPDSEDINPELRGKSAEFTVNLHMGTKKHPAPLDDELAKKTGAETYAELWQNIQGSVGKRIETKNNLKIAEQVVARLLNNHDFKVPQWLVLMESQNMAKAQNKEWESLSSEEILELNKNSEKEIRLSLILDSIRESEPEAVFSEMELIQHLKNNLEQQGYTDPDNLIQKLHKNGSLFGHLASLKDEVTIQWVVNTCKIID
jgi:trigger factor